MEQDKSNWEKVIWHLKEMFPKLKKGENLIYDRHIHLIEGFGYIRIDNDFEMEIDFSSQTTVNNDYVKKYLAAWLCNLEGIEIDLSSSSTIKMTSNNEVLDDLTDLEKTIQRIDNYARVEKAVSELLNLLRESEKSDE